MKYFIFFFYISLCLNLKVYSTSLEQDFMETDEFKKLVDDIVDYRRSAAVFDIIILQSEANPIKKKKAEEDLNKLRVSKGNGLKEKLKRILIKSKIKTPGDRDREEVFKTYSEEFIEGADLGMGYNGKDAFNSFLQYFEKSPIKGDLKEGQEQEVTEKDGNKIYLKHITDLEKGIKSILKNHENQEKWTGLILYFSKETEHVVPITIEKYGESKYKVDCIHDEVLDGKVKKDITRIIKKKEPNSKISSINSNQDYIMPIQYDQFSCYVVAKVWLKKKAQNSKVSFNDLYKEVVIERFRDLANNYTDIFEYIPTEAEELKNNLSLSDFHEKKLENFLSNKKDQVKTFKEIFNTPNEKKDLKDYLKNLDKDKSINPLRNRLSKLVSTVTIKGDTKKSPQKKGRKRDLKRQEKDLESDSSNKEAKTSKLQKPKKKIAKAKVGAKRKRKLFNSKPPQPTAFGSVSRLLLHNKSKLVGPKDVNANFGSARRLLLIDLEEN